MPVSLEHDGALSRIRLEGAIDIGCAQELKELLLNGLKAGSGMRVLLAEAMVLDVTAVQLLCAAERQARVSSVEFAFEGPVTDSVSVALAEAGFEAFAATGKCN